MFWSVKRERFLQSQMYSLNIEFHRSWSKFKNTTVKTYLVEGNGIRFCQNSDEWSKMVKSFEVVILILQPPPTHHLIDNVWNSHSYIVMKCFTVLYTFHCRQDLKVVLCKHNHEDLHKNQQPLIPLALLPLILSATRTKDEYKVKVPVKKAIQLWTNTNLPISSLIFSSILTFPMPWSLRTVNACFLKSFHRVP